MDRAQTIALLSQHRPELQRRFGVLRLALFGSRARDQAQDGSDTDVLVTEKALRPELRPFVERDAIHV
jgi:uncharacterized protein